VLMIKTQIGLGVLSIPSVLDTLGMGPGLVVVIAIGVITTWSNYVIGTFKKNHPSVYGIDDVGYKLFGRAGREFFYVVFVLCEYYSMTVTTCVLNIDLV
jgi:amino acid permease